MAKPPALRLVQVAHDCAKVYCADCQHFLGLQHKDGASPVLDQCLDNRKKCAAKDTLNEFHASVTKEIQEEQANRILFDTLLAEDPFDDGETL